VMIIIADDGKGIPVDTVRKKGLEKGLIKDHDVLTNKEIFNLIFEPGFSTAEKVTNLSGRGVGMDVVRKQIGKLKGIIDIDSEQGRGTRIAIRLPLTLAIVQSLLIKSSNSIFALPISSVIESVRLNVDEIQTVGEVEVIKRHDKVLPLIYLHDVLDLPKRRDNQWYGEVNVSEISIQEPSEKNLQKHASSSPSLREFHSKDTAKKIYVVIVGTGEKRFGIVVDQLLHQQEMVIKPLGPLLSHVPCIAGGSVLGNGEVVLVIDTPELEERFRNRSSRHLSAA
jgi:two-component system chemotaxis sensor kinase CheA